MRVTMARSRTIIQYSKVTGGDHGAWKQGGRWKSFACLYCFRLQMAGKVIQKIPMPQAAFDRIRTVRWDMPCRGPRAHRQELLMRHPEVAPCA